MSILSQDVLDPLKGDVDPLLQELFAAVTQAANNYLTKSTATASLAPVVGIVSDIGLAVATNAINNALGVTSTSTAAAATTVPVAPAT